MFKSTTSKVLLIVALVTAISLVGCSKDDKNPINSQPGDIVGIWNLTGITSQFGGHTISIPKEEIDADPLRYTFYDNNTALQLYQDEETAFTWSLIGNTLTTSTAYETNTYTCEVTTTALRLGFDVVDEGTVYHITHIFTRQ